MLLTEPSAFGSVPQFVGAFQNIGQPGFESDAILIADHPAKHAVKGQFARGQKRRTFLIGELDGTNSWSPH